MAQLFVKECRIDDGLSVEVGQVNTRTVYGAGKGAVGKEAQPLSTGCSNNIEVGSG